VRAAALRVRRCFQANWGLLPAVALMSVSAGLWALPLQVENAGAAPARAASAIQAKTLEASTPTSRSTSSGAASSVPKGTRTPPVRKGPAGLRDPFQAPEPPHHSDASAKAEDAGPRPPGIGGLMIGQLRLEGIVQERGSHLMIALVTGGSNLAYFLRENDRLYDGMVSRIDPDALYLRRNVSGSNGGAKGGEVVLRLGPGKGESQ